MSFVRSFHAPELGGAIALALVGSIAIGGISPPKLASRTVEGTPGERGSFEPDISPDGRYVVFASEARDLVEGDGNNRADVFLFDCGVHKQISPSIRRISLSPSGEEGDGESRFPIFSGDGRTIVFASTAGNFTEGDTNNMFDVFTYDRDPDGNGVLDEGNEILTHISVSSTGEIGNGSSSVPNISADGRYVVFVSDSTNLVSPDTNIPGSFDLFVHDRDPDGDGTFYNSPGQTRRLSLDSTGNEIPNGISVERPAISADGRYVTFASPFNGIVPDDNNNLNDIFLVDRDSDGNGVFDEGPPAISRITESTGTGVSNGASINADISADGSRIVFATESTNLYPGDSNGVSDILLYDRDPDDNGVFDEGNAVFRLVSQTSMMQQADGPSETPRISSDGRYVIFASAATNLVRCDDNEAKDVFIHDLDLVKTRLVSITKSGGLINDDSCLAALSMDGRFAAFETFGDNVVPEDRNGERDVFSIDLRPECREVEPNDTFYQCTAVDFAECKYISGTLQEDCVWDIQPKCFLAAYEKPININSAQHGFLQGIEIILDADYDFDGALTVPMLDDGSLRLGVAALEDGFDGTINGLTTNGLHNRFGEVTLTITFFAENSEGGMGLPVGDPVEYVFRYEGGNEALRLAYEAPEIGGVSAQFARIECDVDTGSTPVRYDVDFFVIENLEPASFYCLTVIGGVNENCDPTDTALGWFDKGGNQQGGPNGVNDDVSPGLAYSELCVLADDQGRLRFAVSGGGDLNFNGLADATENMFFDFLDDLPGFDPQEYEPGASVKDASRACVNRYPRSVWDSEGLEKGQAPETLYHHGVTGGYCIKIHENPHDEGGGVTNQPGENGLAALDCDFNGDGIVDAFDLATLLAHWGPVQQ